MRRPVNVVHACVVEIAGYLEKPTLQIHVLGGAVSPTHKMLRDRLARCIRNRRKDGLNRATVKKLAEAYNRKHNIGERAAYYSMFE